MTTNNAAPLCEARNVSVRLGPTGKLVLENISVTVQPGEIVAVLGPSGCGKSTLLRVLAGLIPSTSGEVLAGGQPLQGVRSDMALVFQSIALYPWLTVRQNVEMALANRDVSSASRAERVERSLVMVGLAGNENAYPKELSGGMKQRVGIARALASDPELLCMDEPFSALDVFTAESLRTELYNLWTRWRDSRPSVDQGTRIRSIVIVTHLIEEAVFLADRIIVMGTNPGRIREIVPNSLPHPRDYPSPTFQAMVHRIHEVIIAEHLPDQEPSATPAAELEPIPAVHVGEILGMVEVVHDHHDQMNVFELNERTARDFGQTLSVATAAEMLDLVETPKEKVRLTDIGLRLVTEPIEGRKAIFREQLLKLPLFQVVLETLRRQPDRHLPRGALVGELSRRITPRDMSALMETVIEWGRFAEVFSFDPLSDAFALAREHHELGRVDA